MISGGGDGALQDFLRIVTRKSAKDIYEILKSQADIKPKLVELERDIQSAEDQAQRAYIWGKTRQHDCDVHRVLHRVHEDTINKLRQDSSVWTIIRNELKILIGASVPDLELVHSCDHFSRCYALNRFLALLVAQYIEDEHRKKVLRSRVQVEDVTGSSHQCANNPISCHGRDHDVTFRESDCRISGTSSKAGPYNVVIVRHGVNPPTYILHHSSGPISHPRQILPYHVAS